MLAPYSLDPIDPRGIDMLAWFNLVGAFGCACWVIAYMMIAWRCLHDRTYGLPLIAICLNFGWESCATFLWPNPAPLWQWFDRAWLAGDMIIVYQLLRFGPAAQTIPAVRRYFYPIVAFVFVAGAAVQHAFVVAWVDRLGLVAAFGINVLMSALFIPFAYARRAHGHGISTIAAWLKMVGTAAAGVQCYWLIPYVDPEVKSMTFLVVICAVTLAIDIGYVVLAHRIVAARAQREADRARARSEAPEVDQMVTAG